MSVMNARARGALLVPLRSKFSMYPRIVYRFGKYLLLSKKWRIERRIPLILSISKNPMKKISYYHVMLNFCIFMTLSICCEKTVGDRKLKFSGQKVRPIANTR